MTISIYFDQRAAKNGQPAPIKFAIRKNGKAAYINIGIKVTTQQWNTTRKEVVDHPNAKRINLIINKKKLEIDSAVLRLMENGESGGLTALQLRDKIIDIIDPQKKQEIEESRLFRNRFIRFMELKDNVGTRGLYAYTLRKLEAHDINLATRSFENITNDYLREFEAFCAKTEKKNSRNIHLRNIRAVFNDAINSGITTSYPFRKYPLKQESTRKKALMPKQLKSLLNAKCEPYQEQYRDLFVLMFLLRGINAGDLFLATVQQINNGRLDYRRNKTGTLMSVKIEPEAQALLEKYKGKKLLLNPMDAYDNYKDYLHHFNTGLKAIGRPVGKKGKVLGKGIFPDLSSNWARHTWATVAMKIGIPKEVISKGMGHSFGLKVTDIYIEYDNDLVDNANRKIIDYIFYDKDYRNKD